MGISKHPIREENMRVNTYFLIQYANSEIVRMEWLRGGEKSWSWEQGGLEKRGENLEWEQKWSKIGCEILAEGEDAGVAREIRVKDEGG